MRLQALGFEFSVLHGSLCLSCLGWVTALGEGSASAFSLGRILLTCQATVSRHSALALCVFGVPIAVRSCLALMPGLRLWCCRNVPESLRPLLHSLPVPGGACARLGLWGHQVLRCDSRLGEPTGSPGAPLGRSTDGLRVVVYT